MSNLSLERLNFDPAAPTVGPLLGSYLLAADGTVITDSGASGALDVYLQNASIAVTASDLDIRDLTHVSDSVKIGDGTDFLGVNADGSINVAVTSLTASDVDIRDLTHVSDSVKIGDGTDFLAVNADGSINVNLTDDGIADGAADSGNPLKVGVHAYDQASVWSAVDADDRANLASDLYRRVLVNDAPNVSAACAAVTVDTTVGGVLLGTAIAGRTRIIIQNRGDKSMFVGPSGVTTSSGLEVSKGGTLSLELGEAVDLYGIVASGSVDARVMQLA